MTQLVINENYQYFKMRLPNTYLISAGIFMSKTAYDLLVSNFSDDDLVRNALNENQFSTGAMNHLYEMLNQAFATQNRSRSESLNTLKLLLDKWLLTVDLERAVIE